MDLYQWLCLFGVPTVIVGLFRYLRLQIRETRSESGALKSGIQALLRAQMISEYNKWTERGYAPIYARENFENCWDQYHALGANGVMDDIHNKFLRLPTDPSGQNERREKLWQL